MKKFLLVLGICFLLCGCSSNKVESEVENIMKEGNYIIVDVRTKDEFMKNHVIGAINIPYDEIDGSNLDKDKTIFVYCRSGSRSKVAFDRLTELGYMVYDLGAFDDVDLPKE